jgi:hypothetical protein
MFKLTGLEINKNYYTYVFINPIDNKPFYIGKGIDQRYLQHFREIAYKKSTNKHKTNTIKKIIKSNNDVIIDIIFTSNNEEECFNKEIELIKLYGRRNNKTGILTNLTEGGDGSSGREILEETRTKISNTRKQKIQNGSIVPAKHSQEHRQKLRVDNAGGRATSKPIYQIDTNGNVIKEWPSSRQAGIGLGIKCWRNISHVANKLKGRKIKGFYWRWINDKDIIDGHLQNIQTINDTKKILSLKTSKSVLQIAKNDTIIALWPSLTEAAKSVNGWYYAISNAAKTNKLYKNYKWNFVTKENYLCHKNKILN